MSAAQKHEREALRAIEALSPRLHAYIDTRRRNTHKCLTATIDGVTVEHSISSSPRDASRATRAATRDVRRKLIDKGVKL